jgi:membrane protein DedA with SNARE-associated domain
MGMDALIIRYGYLALFAGSFLEGESIVLASGFAAHRGWLSLPLVIVVAALGATLGDQAFFLLGRYRRDWLYKRMPKLAGKLGAVAARIEGREAWAIIAARFIYGMRVASAVAFGATSISAARYALWNVTGAVIWAAVIASGGYLFGAAAERVLTNLRSVEGPVFIALLAIGLALALWYRSRANR